MGQEISDFIETTSEKLEDVLVSYNKKSGLRDDNER